MVNKVNASELMTAAKELSELVDDVESFLNELKDVVDDGNINGELTSLENFLDKWETRTISSNDKMLGNVFYEDPNL